MINTYIEQSAYSYTTNFDGTHHFILDVARNRHINIRSKQTNNGWSKYCTRDLAYIRFNNCMKTKLGLVFRKKTQNSSWNLMQWKILHIRMFTLSLNNSLFAHAQEGKNQPLSSLNFTDFVEYLHCWYQAWRNTYYKQKPAIFNFCAKLIIKSVQISRISFRIFLSLR